MKKALSLILALVVCLSLCACSSTAATKNAIIGEWYQSDSDANYVIFNSDGTGKKIVNEDIADFKWKYDNDLECYILLFDSIISVTIQEEDGMTQLSIDGNTYVPFEDHEKAYGKYQEELRQQQESLRKEANPTVEQQLLPESKQLEIGKKYTHTNGLTFTIEAIEKTTESLSDGATDVVWLVIAFDDAANAALLNKEIRIEGGFYQTTNFGWRYPMSEYISEQLGTKHDFFRIDPQHPENTTCYHFKKYLPQGTIRFPFAIYGNQGIDTFEEEVYGIPMGFVRIHIDNVVYHIWAEDMPSITN